ncbi:hypothetical protein J4417_00350 [Candidatus Woesearchaeota archaeon]|nr:hypothetical protein [Candidatus Woesearchaeota archaeon]
MDFWRPGNIEYFREVGALRSSPIGEFWNTTLHAKARGFKPSNVFVKKNANYPRSKERGFSIRIFETLTAFISTLKCGAFGLVKVRTYVCHVAPLFIDDKTIFYRREEVFKTYELWDSLKCYAEF